MDVLYTSDAGAIGSKSCAADLSVLFIDGDLQRFTATSKPFLHVNRSQYRGFAFLRHFLETNTVFGCFFKFKFYGCFGHSAVLCLLKLTVRRILHARGPIDNKFELSGLKGNISVSIALSPASAQNVMMTATVLSFKVEI